VDVFVLVGRGAVDHLDLVDINQDTASHRLSPLPVILGRGEHREDPGGRGSGKGKGGAERTDLADLERETP
jgi:hypothetical protein